MHTASPPISRPGMTQLGSRIDLWADDTLISPGCRGICASLRQNVGKLKRRLTRGVLARVVASRRRAPAGRGEARLRHANPLTSPTASARHGELPALVVPHSRVNLVVRVHDERTV